ncbi:hypothetical protein DL95DRAFT_470413 [Leptodontidium sp. 2 PMI_412]|nr:hypothetical protein BKA61DRAFT_666350 [Leptodontidium sp. MPI-SDFR-AT-0119]KAH9205605.1 hypothetical protein DL95DRAFT_470413 [Leptodontidium sp. 2 PMI_412]
MVSFSQITFLFALIAPVVMAAVGNGGQCKLQTDCCVCDPGSKRQLGCFQDSTSTTGFRCGFTGDKGICTPQC